MSVPTFYIAANAVVELVEAGRNWTHMRQYVDACPCKFCIKDVEEARHRYELAQEYYEEMERLVGWDVMTEAEESYDHVGRDIMHCDEDVIYGPVYAEGFGRVL